MGGGYLNWTNKARAVPIESEINRRGIQLRRNGVESVGPCPKCGGDDRFSINPTKQVFNCRGCSVGGGIIDLVMFLDGVDFNEACVRLAGEQPKANGKDRSKAAEIVVASFQWHDADGNLVLITERIEYQGANGEFIVKDKKRDKTFRQKRPDPDNRGRWIYNADGVPPVPYRLPELLEAIANKRPILIVEGEAKADLLWSWGVAATCCVGGAKKWKPEHSEFLRGADVFLLPDNDNAGWEHIHKVGALLSTVAKSIRVLSLPELPLKGDIIDWRAAGGTREQLDALLEQAPTWQLPTAKDQAAEATAREDELIASLAKLTGLEYKRERKRLAEELDLSQRDIDEEARGHREAAPLHGHWIVEPWPEPADGDSLLRDIVRRIHRHVICSADQGLVIGLWVMFSWVHDEIAIHSPILLITSAEPESGKTTILNPISYLAPRAIASVEISQAALYRAIKLWRPSFIIDEFDDVLSSRDGDKTELRSVINSGHTRGQVVIRCVSDEYRPEPFSTFAPKAIGMVGRKLPVTSHYTRALRYCRAAPTHQGREDRALRP